MEKKYKITIKVNEIEFSTSFFDSEEKAFKVFKILNAELSEKFEIKVFKIEKEEKQLITENWKP